MTPFQPANRTLIHQLGNYTWPSDDRTFGSPRLTTPLILGSLLVGCPKSETPKQTETPAALNTMHHVSAPEVLPRGALGELGQCSGSAPICGTGGPTKSSQDKKRHLAVGTPGEHQSRWQMDVHPPQNKIATGYALWPFWDSVGR